MINKTLIILAAGIGARYGEGIKQLTPIDSYGHLIIDYSIHDAIDAGFKKIIFVIRHDIEVDFRRIIGNRIEEVCSELNVEISYAFQELSNVPFPVPRQRTKPWGTGHAVLCCEELVSGPFAVINADDYYGRQAFKLAADYLENNPKGYGLIGYILDRTLSENGGVTRGICSVEDGKLKGIKETKNIVRTEYGIQTDDEFLGSGEIVSMNFWCFPKIFMVDLFFGLTDFHRNMKDPLKDEFLLPAFADDLIKRDFTFEVLYSSDSWFGITYKEDKPNVVENIKQLIDGGLYCRDLYGDLCGSIS